MPFELSHSDVQFTVFTELRSGRTAPFMLDKFLRRYLLAAVLTSLFGMEILVVLVKIVDIYHLLALITPTYVPATVAKVTVDLRLRKVLTTVLTLLHRLH